MTDRNAAAKDALLAWAFRYVSDKGAIRTTDQGPFYGSQEMEFFAAVKRLIPDIEERAVDVHDHADLAVSRALDRH